MVAVVVTVVVTPVFTTQESDELSLDDYDFMDILQDVGSAFFILMIVILCVLLIWMIFGCLLEFEVLAVEPDSVFKVQRTRPWAATPPPATCSAAIRSVMALPW